MSENKHTPEPWIAVPGGRYDYEVIITTQHRLDQSMGEICGMDVEFTGKHGEEQKANARRLVACVNACAGIPTDDLEASPKHGLLHLAEFSNELVKQRDELNSIVTNQRQQIAHLNDDLAGQKSNIDFIKKQRDELLVALKNISEESPDKGAREHALSAIESAKVAPINPASLLPDERECCGTFPRTPHRATCKNYRGTKGSSK